jgi:hypothetical protein
MSPPTDGPLSFYRDVLSPFRNASHIRKIDMM